VNKNLANKAKAAASKVVASKVAASKSRASKVVRTLDRVASKVVADSKSRASSLDSANSYSTRILSRLRAGFFLTWLQRCESTRFSASVDRRDRRSFPSSGT
jgi:hypothetical protein